MLGYPKLAKLKGGLEIRLRNLVEKDKEALKEFFLNLPLEDRMFLKEDVTNPKVIDAWFRNIDYDHVLPILAFDGEKVIGDATLHIPEYGWSRHVGEMRFVVASEYQKKGIGTLLAKEIFNHAVERRLDKLEVKVVGNQVGPITVLTRLGFKKLATLPGYVTDLRGNRRDLIIMINDIKSLVSSVDAMMPPVEYLPAMY